MQQNFHELKSQLYRKVEDTDLKLLPTGFYRRN